MVILDEFMTDIANAIRTKSQKSDLIPATSFASEILSIPQTVTNINSGYTYTIIGISSSGTGSATVADNFTIPAGKTKACILGIVNTQGVSDWSCTVSSGSTTITETLHYDTTNSYNDSQAVNHKLKTYDIVTDGNECVINIVCGKSSNANRFAFAVSIY